MNLANILACDAAFLDVLVIVQWAIKIICIGIPVILIVLVIADLAKVVTAGNIDDKIKKEVSQKVLTRVIYSIIIFLVPTIVDLFFRLVPVGNEDINGNTWSSCWNEAKEHKYGSK